MSLYVSTNSAAVKANFHLGRNSSNLQKSLARLSSGNRITQPADDAGGLAVSMKLKASINRLATQRLLYISVWKRKREIINRIRMPENS